MKVIRVVVLWSVLSQACGIAAPAPADAPSWSLKKYVTDVTIPAGTYRSAQNIILIAEGKSVTIESSFLDRVGFQGEKDLKMHVTGSFWRDGDVAGDLGSTFTGKDSAFENCLFHKGGGWFLSLWSTRWRFENCVFSKQFMSRADLGVTDYSVTAVNCSFFNMDLPKFTYKGDPAEQAQHNQLKFDRCRFVKCEVPESFLAATVNCVFEDCRFGAKQQDWAKGTQLIAVNAFIVGLDRAPQSYMSGVLNVTFNTMPPPPAGANINVMNAEGKLTYTTLAPTSVRTLGAFDPAIPAATPKAEPTPPLAGIPPASRHTPAPSTPVIPPLPTPSQQAAAPAPTPPVDSKSLFGIPVDSGPQVIKTLHITSASVTTPLFVPQAAGGYNAVGLSLSTSITPITPAAACELVFGETVDPAAQKQMAITKQYLTKRHRGWPIGNKIEIACPQKVPSADLPATGLATTLLVDSMMLGYKIDPGVWVIGGIDKEAAITPVIAAATRLTAALRAAPQRIIVSEKNMAQVADLMLAEGVAAFANTHIFSVQSFDEVPGLAKYDMDDALIRAMKSFATVQGLLNAAGANAEAALKDPPVKEALRDVLIAVPHHLSARLLLGHGGGQYNHFSIAGSIETIEGRAPYLVRCVRSTSPAVITGLTTERVTGELAKLQVLRDRLNASAVPWFDALLKYGEAAKASLASPQGAGVALIAASRAVQTEWPKLIALRDAKTR